MLSFTKLDNIDKKLIAKCKLLNDYSPLFPSFVDVTTDGNVYTASYPCNMKVVFDKDFNFVEASVFGVDSVFSTSTLDYTSIELLEKEVIAGLSKELNLAGKRVFVNNFDLMLYICDGDIINAIYDLRLCCRGLNRIYEDNGDIILVLDKLNNYSFYAINPNTFEETLLYNTDKVGRKFRKQVRR